ncbi:MAG TPA: hypothetical protein VLQ45_29390 [Thermoanaerobaculia bacterium]|nr:hypothetical protein [Thermoanaerobaculia bacterium]
MHEDQEPATLTVTEFVKLAGDRGVRLWTFIKQGRTVITSGVRMYTLPELRRGYLPAALLESLCNRFSLPYQDFTLDPREED